MRAGSCDGRDGGQTLFASVLTPTLLRLPFKLVLLQVLTRVRRKFHKKIIFQRVGFLFSGFREDKYFWEVRALGATGKGGGSVCGVLFKWDRCCVG